MINRKRIREYISCPELGDDHYGRWGILTKEQRLTIYDLLKILDSSDCVIENLYQENNKLKNKIDKAINLVNNEIYKNRCECSYCNSYYLKEMLKILKDSDVDE